MAEIEASLLAKVQNVEKTHGQPVLVGSLRSRRKRVGTLIEATSGRSLKDLKREVKKKGGKKLKVYKEINTIYAEMPVDKVEDMASVSCAQKLYDAEGDIRTSLYESVPLVMGIEKGHLPYRVRGRKVEGKGVKVAIIDSGVDKNHPDFGGRIKASKNFSGGRRYKGRDHGTHVAGIIAGSGKASGYRHTGVAPKATLYDAKVFIDEETATTRDTIIDAILWAVKKNVDVINMSFGDNHGCTDGSCPLCKIADYAVNKDITVVAAAGNVGPAEGTISCPGNAKEVITVGASTKSSPTMVMGFSSRGSSRQSDKPDVVAPGENITAPQPGGYYTAMTGTSMAAPHVSGMAALLYQMGKYVHGGKRVSPTNIKTLLKQGSVDLGEHPTAQGNGLINFEKEVATLQQSHKHPRRVKRKKKLAVSTVNDSQTAEQPAEVAAPELLSKTCPAAVKMYCPHYEGRICNEVYSTCIHYHAVSQVKILEEIKQLHKSPWAYLSAGTLAQNAKVSAYDRGTTKATGRLTGTIQGKALGGVTIKIGNQSTITDVDGRFKLYHVPRGTLPANLSGESIYPCSLAMNTAKLGSIKVNTIEKSSHFNLDFYRELARGNHPREREIHPLYRWTRSKAPTFYIDTNASSIDGKITSKTIKRVKKVIKKIVPIFSGNAYRNVSIKVKEFPFHNFDAIPDYSIVISFDDSLRTKGVLGITYTTPDFTKSKPGSLYKARIYVVNHEGAYSSNDISKEAVVAHEIGHGFGFRHTSLLASIMDKYRPSETLFTEHDTLHMKVMYNRPVGNTDIDNDPIPAGTTRFTQAPKEEVFIDKWDNSSIPDKLRKRLESLPSPNQDLFLGY